MEARILGPQRDVYVLKRLSNGLTQATVWVNRGSHYWRQDTVILNALMAYMVKAMSERL